MSLEGYKYGNGRWDEEEAGKEGSQENEEEIMATAGRRLRVFVSYSHADERLRQLLDAQLANLKRSHLIEIWCDRGITAGREFDPAIAGEIQSADLILLLVTANFLNSDYCSSVELAAAMKRHNDGTARVVPIILRPCDWHSSPFGKLLATPTDAKPVTEWRSRDKAFIDIVDTLRRIIQELTTSNAAQDTAKRVLPEVIEATSQSADQSSRQLQPITKHFVEWRVRIHDRRGTEATVWKTTALIANVPNITTLVDRHFVSTGKLAFVSASLGNVDGPVDEGGTLSVTTILREPLPVGREVINILTIKASDTFTSSRETFGHTITERSQRIKIGVELPADRPAVSVFPFRVLDGRKEALADPVLSADKLHLELEVKNAPVGSKYILEWLW